MSFNQRNAKTTAALRTACTGVQSWCVYATNTCNEQEVTWWRVTALTALPSNRRNMQRPFTIGRNLRRRLWWRDETDTRHKHNWGFRSFGVLAGWGGSWLTTYRGKISVQLQSAKYHLKCSWHACLFKDGTDILSRNVVSQLQATQLLLKEGEGLHTAVRTPGISHYNHSFRNNTSYNNSASQGILYLHHFEERMLDRQN
jgi:hypothetical protein